MYLEYCMGLDHNGRWSLSLSPLYHPEEGSEKRSRNRYL